MSEKVYNVVLDCKLMNEEEEYVDATISALVSVLWRGRRENPKL